MGIYDIILLRMTMKKSRKITVIVVSAVAGVVLITGLIIGGFAFYLISSRQHCSEYAKDNEHRTGLAESMSYYSLYNPCMERKGLRNL